MNFTLKKSDINNIEIEKKARAMGMMYPDEIKVIEEEVSKW